jgi:hypothetical protein
MPACAQAQAQCWPSLAPHSLCQSKQVCTHTTTLTSNETIIVALRPLYTPSCWVCRGAASHERRRRGATPCSHWQTCQWPLADLSVADPAHAGVAGEAAGHQNVRIVARAADHAAADKACDRGAYTHTHTPSWVSAYHHAAGVTHWAQLTDVAAPGDSAVAGQATRDQNVVVLATGAHLRTRQGREGGQQKCGDSPANSMPRLNGPAQGTSDSHNTQTASLTLRPPTNPVAQQAGRTGHQRLTQVVSQCGALEGRTNAAAGAGCSLARVHH